MNSYKKIRLQNKIESVSSELTKNSDEITTISSINQNKIVYIGKNQYTINQKYNPIQQLFDYVQHSLDSVLFFINSKKFQVNLLTDFAQIILHFIYAIVDFQNKLHFQIDDEFVFLNYDKGHLEYTIKYAVVDGQLLTSECVWYQNKTIILNKKMILAALERADDTCDILFDHQLENFKVNYNLYDICGEDQKILDASIIPKLCMLFVIADHAVQHIFDGPTTDYINHQNFGKNIQSISSTINISQLGDIKQLLSQNFDSYIKI